MSRLAARLARLEGRGQDGRSQVRVVWLRPDGLPEDPADLDREGPTIYLPRKSKSTKQWMAECAARGHRPWRQPENNVCHG